MLHSGEKVTPAGYNNDVTNKEVIEQLKKMSDNVSMLKDEYSRFNTFVYQLISEGSEVAFNTRTVA
jgi:predicted translin family RNA/ssDNA-binding protein